MKDKNSAFQLIHPLEVYLEHLTTINDTPLTQREIDVLSCLLNGRSRQGIANFLSISTKTVDTHINKITHKFGCNSVSMISLLENSAQFLALKEYYLALLIDNFFKKSLEEIAKLMEGERTTLLKSVLVYWNKKPPFLEYIENDLTKAGLAISLESRKDVPSFYKLAQEIYHDTYLIYFLPESLIEEGSIGQETNTKIPKRSIEGEQCPEMKIFFLPKVGKKRDSFQRIDTFTYINASEWNSYYSSVFVILKKSMATTYLDEIYAKFEEKAKVLQSSSFSSVSQSSSEGASLEANKKENYIFQFRKIFRTKKLIYYSLAGFLAIGLLLFWTINDRGIRIKPVTNKNKEYQQDASTAQETIVPSTIQSALIIPTKPTFLNRSQLVDQIDKYFQQQSQGIQTVALVGLGGAGKTTLARHYARQEKAPIIWEINAETKESLRNSFEKLAQHLAKKEDDEKAFRCIQEIKNPTEREEKFMLFTQEHLKAQPGWFLIYDNVENFMDIQNYFPQDIKFWGKGKVILTTRNTNLQNNSHVNHSISIGELSQSEKFNLFMQIMNHREDHKLAEAQKTEIIAFLKQIPPFPLDISVAAYYLKTMNIPYSRYLEHLNQPDNNFSSLQENLLKEEGHYFKTRYSIITLSLEKIIKKNKDFCELFLFISLLDSQNIPKDLLNFHKNEAVVDNFIYNLKKYSIVTNNFSNSDSYTTFSIHRSTQKIVLSYLTKKLNLLEDKIILENICNTFVNYIVDTIENNPFLKMEVLLTHGIVFLSHQNLLTNKMKASISGGLGGIYCYQGSYVKAKKSLASCFKILDRKMDPILFAHFSRYLAKIHITLGNYEKSINLLKENLKIYNKYSKNHKDVARTLGYLGSIYRKIGKYKNAQLLLEESLKIYKSHYPQNHVLLPWACQNLGNLYQDQGNYEKAKNLFEEGLKIYKLYFPANKVETANLVQRLGIIYRDLGHYEKSKNLLEQCLNIYEENLFESHYSIARALAYLGSAYIELKNYEKAKNLLEKSLMLYKKHISEKHVNAALALGYLGNAHKGLKNYSLAKYYLQKNLKVYEDRYGKTHLKTAYVLRNLGRVHLLEDNFEMAKKFLDKALRIFQRDKHPDIYTCLESFSDLYLKESVQSSDREDLQQSQFFKTKAADYLKKALKIVKTHFLEDSPHMERIQTKLKRLE